MCAVGHWMYDRGYVAGADGNLSLRLDASHILASPTCLSKGMMQPDDLVVTDLEGRRLNGGREPSSEILMHLLIYRQRPDVNAVCHAHPPAATGYAAAGIPLDSPLLAELVVTLGSVPLAPYGMPGTPALSKAIEPFVSAYDAILLANHGVVTYGCDLLTAFFRMETAEHFARVALVTKILGEHTLLSRQQVNALETAHPRNGARGAAEPGHNGSAPPRPHESERISLTRSELDALIEAAIAKERIKQTA